MICIVRAASVMLAALYLVHNKAYRNIRSYDMIILRFLCKIFHTLCGSTGTLSDSIDSHKWESKAEISRSLSSRTM
jgi:hypothetical protein